VGQEIDLLLDLDECHIQFRLARDEFRMKEPAIVEVDAQILGREDMVVDSEDMPLGRDEDAAAVGGKPLEAAGAEELDHALVHVGRDRGEGLLGVQDGRAGQEETAGKETREIRHSQSRGVG
jgi:hypothetical protein